MIVQKEKFFFLEYEQILLNKCLNESNEYLTLCIKQGVLPEFFFRPEHQILFQIFLKFFYKNIYLDFTNLIFELREKNLLDVVGGVKYIDYLKNITTSLWDIDFLIKKIRDFFFFRQLRSLFLKIIDIIDNINSIPFQKFLNIVDAKIVSLKSYIKPKFILRSNLILNSVVKGIFNTNCMERNLGIMTGFQDLDRLLYSIQGGDLCIVAARPGLGKTSFSLNIIENVVLKNSNIGILFFSLEMTSEQLLTRLLCTISKLNLHSIREGILDKLKFKILCKNINKLKKINLWVDDSSYLNILDIKSKIKKFHSSNDLGLVIIDYIQLVDNINSRLNREQQISHVSRTLKNIAKEFRIPIIALSQLNRESEKIERDPKLSDLRESGSIEQDADSVIIITNYIKNFNFKNPHLNVRQLFVAKNRNGPTGTATLIFNNSITKFENHFESKKVKRKK